MIILTNFYKKGLVLNNGTSRAMPVSHIKVLKSCNNYSNKQKATDEKFDMRCQLKSISFYLGRVIMCC